MTVMEAIERRRAVRAYTPERIDERTLKTLLHAAVRAPTAIHLEPWAFAIVQDRALLERISRRAEALMLTRAMEQPSGAASAHPEGGHFAHMLANPGFNIFYDAGTLVVICARPLGRFVDADCWLAAENLILAATAMGLGTCVIGAAIEALNDPETRRELQLPEGVRAVAPIIVGVPAGETPPTARNPPQLLCWK